MRFSRLCVVSLVVLVVGGGLAACQRSGPPDVDRTEEGVMRLGSVEVVDTVSRTVALNDRLLVLEGLRGSVHLTGADPSTADLSFIRRGRGDRREAAQSVLEGISITERGTDREYTYTLSAEKDAYAAVDLRGRVPRETELQIDRLSGPVHLEGVEGMLTIEHEHGAVDVEGASAPVEMTLKDGDVQVDFQTVPVEGSSLLQTGNGDIHLRLPAEASAQIDARTNAGLIRTQGLSFTAEQFAPIDAGARYTAQLGTDGPPIELRTQNGSITIRAIEPAQADTSDTTSVSTPGPATVPSTDTTVVPQPDSDTTSTDTMSVDTTAADTTSEL